jgi:CRISPR-associated protein Cmr4
MYTAKQTVYIKAISPVHAGTGQSIDSVDMPIQRERHSGIPKIEGSGLKGSIKHFIYRPFYSELEELKKKETDLKKENKELIETEKTRKKDLEEIEKKIFAYFGSDDGSEFASAIGITDAKLLLFPIKSTEGIFKLITCPYVLNRWLEDIGKSLVNLTVEDSEYIPLDNTINGRIVLEEYIFSKVENLNDSKHVLTILDTIKNANKNCVDTSKVVILNDTTFIDLVTMYTEVITRNKINILTGTAEGTGLFTEEYLPCESVMYFNVLGSPSFDSKNPFESQDVLDYFNKYINSVFQVGGNATIGKGLVKILNPVEVTPKKEGEKNE